MREHPILSRGDMVKASLEGRKTQTRRVITPIISSEGFKYPITDVPEQSTTSPYYSIFTGEQHAFKKCPYGVPGDILWVRETWRTAKGLDKYPPRMTGPKSPFQYKSDMASIRGSDVTKYSPWGRWRASIHMPRWASRIDLEIIDIRTEQVQDISDEDIIAEGILGDSYLEELNITGRDPRSARGYFMELWNSINEKRGYGWDKNPLVWVVKFKVKKRETQMKRTQDAK